MVLVIPFMFSLKHKHWYIAGLIIYSFLNIMVLNGDRLYAAKLPPEYLFFIIGYLCYGIWYINLAIERSIAGRLKKVHPIFSQFFLSVTGIVLLSVLSVLITSNLLGQPFNFIQKNVLLTAGFSFRVNLFLNALSAVYFFNRKYREKELEAEKLKSLTLSAKYEALNSQINPHFLFNSLNTLSTLINSDPKRANVFLQKLSGIYRYLLKTNSEELVPLSEEVKFLMDYIELLHLRFENSLFVKVNLNTEKTEKMVPPTVLQLLLENVVKHNYFTKEEPIYVNIVEVGDEIQIQNNLQKKPNEASSFGLGLKNITERYEFFNKSISVNEDSEHYTVNIPTIAIANEVAHS